MKEPCCSFCFTPKSHARGHVLVQGLTGAHMCPDCAESLKVGIRFVSPGQVGYFGPKPFSLRGGNHDSAA